MTERPDRVSASLAARSQGSRVLVTGETTESNLTYANADSTFTIEAAGGIARVKRGEAWVPVDPALAEAGGVLRPRATKADVEFSAGGGDRPLAKMSYGDGRFIALSWPTALPRPTVKGAVATYADAAGRNADLVVTALPAGFRHDVVLRQRPTAPVRFELPVQTEGVTLGVTEDGGLKLSTGKGEVVASAPAPVVYESPPGDGPRPARATGARAPIAARVTGGKARRTLVLEPDAKFLADPRTRYPVTVDPTTTLTSLAARTLNSPCTNGHAGEATSWELSPAISGNDDYECGYAANGSRVSRGLIRFDTASLAGQDVVDARLELVGDLLHCPAGQRLRVRRLTGTWNPNSVTWSGQPASTADGEVLSAPPAVCGPTSYTEDTPWSIPVTAIAKAWAGGAAGRGLVLAPGDEQNRAESFGWYFDDGGATAPKLVVTFGTTPWIDGQARLQPVAAGDHKYYTNTLTPTLFAGVRDIDGGLLRAEYQVEHDPSVPQQGTGLAWSGAVDDVPAGTEARITIPSGYLSDGWKLRWRARASDGSSVSAWSEWQVVTVDATPPTAEIHCTYPSGQWRAPITDAECGVYTEGTDAEDPEPTEIWWGLDDPGLPELRKDGWGWTGDQKAIWFPIEATSGRHTLYAKVRDKGHNTSTLATYTFGVGAGGLTGLKPGARTQGSVTLAAAAPPGRTDVRYEYRASLYDLDDWVTVPSADVTVPGSGRPLAAWPQNRTNTAEDFGPLSWDLAKSLHDASVADGTIEVRACLSGGATGEECTDPARVTLDRSAFGGSYATANVGPGKVALQSGDYLVSLTDADLFGVQVRRSLTTLVPEAERADEQLAENKIFGPGWRAGFPAGLSANDYALVGEGESGSLQMLGSDGSTLSYVKDGAGFAGVGDAADGSRITPSGDQLVFTDPVGAKTTYTEVLGRWVVARTESSATESAVTYFRDAQGRITRVLAPVSAGVTCGATLTAGCRALELSYAAATTATGVASGWGDFAGQARTVSFTAFDPAANAMRTSVIASYRYDTTGHLRQVTDPRLGLSTVYYYNGEGRVSQITPPGLAPWRMEYDTRGRISHVQRENGDTDLTQAVAYDVPIGGAGAPVDLTVTQTAKWGQTSDLPVVGTAVFPATRVPARGTDGAYRPGGGDWEYGRITYMDVNGRPVNMADYGAGAWQVGTSRFDDKGNVVWNLSPRNRAHALTPNGETDPYVAGRRDSAERADLLAGIDVYNEDSDVLSRLTPARPVVLVSGAVVSARQRTTYAYDEGKPSSSIRYHLITTTKVEPLVLDGTAAPDAGDVRTTRTGYDPVMAGDTSGWTLRMATSATTVMPGQADIVQRTRYDAAGREIESRMPRSGGADAGTTVSHYYTADPQPGVPECGNKPQWSGLSCRTAPAAQPSGRPIPATTLTYGYLEQITSRTDRSGSTTRTSTSGYDAAGRLTSTTVAVTPAAAGGTPVPDITYAHDPDTGLPATVSAGGSTITTGYDSLGRVISYSEPGNTASYTYDEFGRTATVSDGKGTATHTYDGTDAAGKQERRGQVTKIDVSGVGAFTAAYDADGRQTGYGLPGGLTATYRFDNTGAPASLTYAKNGATWMSFTATSDVLSRTVRATGPAGDQRYAYDAAGRLTKAEDTWARSCVTRVYAYDADTNRTGLSTYPSAPGGACSTNTAPAVVTHAYDAADRIADPGYTYDDLGRVLTTPAAHVADGGNVTSAYFANDVVAGLDQGGRSQTFTIDPIGRIRTMGDADGTITDHYSSGSDSPAWISETNGAWTRYVLAFDRLAAVQASDGTVKLQLTNLHDDVVGTTGTTASAGLDAYFEFTEFGAARDDTGAGKRFGWLGAKERSADPLGGLVLMGVRLYNPGTGRMLQSDPVTGGCANRQDYAMQDPVNGLDLDGRACRKRLNHDKLQSCLAAAAIAIEVATAACATACGATLGLACVCFIAVVAVATALIAACWLSSRETCCTQNKTVTSKVTTSSRVCAKRNKKGQCTKWTTRKITSHISKTYTTEVCR
ncbi:DNRLRE domain-containing protein [Sphaerisporangium krabiense]|uniref:RHS repeat-associated protein n=1 Tax=Sphaerisporangium krabiense TaxID=763782 RepID=A0A7W8ZA41_9ACTN|nr:DNRLRE domain-containing protein [Sphaerisporangium krabiense]MBB5630197.1 RHS repeat-associated protein [Sphaerisporangium krabiense]